MWGRMSTVCGTRGSAGPGDDEQRKWVSMDEWRETEGEKNGQRREGAQRRKEGTGKVSFWIITGGESTAGSERGNKREESAFVFDSVVRML